MPWNERPYPLDWDAAVAAWPKMILERAWTHKALNKLIQGSAADVMKRSMVNVYQAGFTPHLTVHDELDISLEKGSVGEKQGRQIQEIMQNCVKLQIPLLVDAERGETWGSVEEVL
jgi:DNA polymerase I-like protein with 3'-5' exonuclease and polymerase domains